MNTEPGERDASGLNISLADPQSHNEDGAKKSERGRRKKKQ